VDRFLSDRNLSRSDIGSYVCHPGGPRVIEAVQRALDLDEAALAATWESLKAVGNLSSASVLMVLRDTMETRRPHPGTYGLMIAMGPGFCAELVLLQW
jgi:alkylresorcinol/alkylpyrone synthase